VFARIADAPPGGVLVHCKATDIAAYLTNSGLTFEQLDRLRERLVSP